MIRTVLGIAILAAIVVTGFWLSAIYTGYVSPNDANWVKLNSNLPTFARDWACSEVKNRSGQAPAHCQQ